MSNPVNYIEICFDLDVNCKKIHIEWLSLPGVLVQCEINNCVRIAPDPYSLTKGEKCIEGWVHCDDCKFGNSKPIYFKKCFCKSGEDCSNCQGCDKTTTVDGYGICVDKLTEKQKAEGRDCNGDCPPDKPYFNGTINSCAECREGETNPNDPCYECQNGTWTKKCDNCDPKTGECKDCLTDDDCKDNTDGRTKCGPDGCQCENGFYYDLTERKCKEIPECDGIGDCPDCFDCVKVELPDGTIIKKCVKTVCKPGFICIPGKGCVKECDCDTKEGCNETSACIQDPITKQCYCNDCNVGCSEGCPEGCYCPKNNPSNKCKPNPCHSTSCTDGNDCGKLCGCNELTNKCEPCDSKDCNICESLTGCQCINGQDCTKGDDCSQLSCPEGCENNPECKCVGGNNCETQPCDDSNFRLELEECDNEHVLAAVLTANKCCKCPELEFVLETSLKNNSQHNHKLWLKKNVNSGVNNPLLTDDEHPLVMNEEELTSGMLNSYAKYTFQAINNGNPLQLTEEVTLDVNRPLSEGQSYINQSFNETNHDVLTLGALYSKSIQGQVYPDAELINIKIVYEVTRLVNSRSTCVYKKRKIAEINYSNLNQIDVVNLTTVNIDSDDCSRPPFIWTRANETTPFRKKYVPRNSQNEYRDWIKNDPKLNRFFTEDTNLDDKNDILSNLPYDVITPCGCNGTIQASYESCNNKVYFCNPCDAQLEFRDGCETRVKFVNPFITDYPVNMDLGPQNPISTENDYKTISQVSWKLTIEDVNGGIKEYDKIAAYPSGLIWSNNITFETDGYTKIKSWKIEHNHDECERCVLEGTFEPNKLELNFDISCELHSDPKYKIVTVKLSDYPDNIGNITLGALNRSNVGDDSNVDLEFDGDTTKVYCWTLITLIDEQYIVGTIYLDNGCEIKIDNLEIPNDCDTSLLGRINAELPNCNSVNKNYKYDFNTQAEGTYEWVNVNGDIIGTTSSINLEEDDPLLLGPITMTFTPILGNQVITETFNIETSSTTFIQSNNEGAEVGDKIIIHTCGSNIYNLEFDFPDCSGSVSYYFASSSNIIRSAIVNSNGKIEIGVPYNNSNVETVIITDYLTTDCCIEISPNTYEIIWEEGCTITGLNSPVNAICFGEDVPLNIVGSGNCTLTIELFNNSNPNTIIETYNVAFNGSAQYYISNVQIGTNWAFRITGTTNNVNNECNSDVELVKDIIVGMNVQNNSNATVQLNTCNGKPNGTSDFIVTVYDVNGNLDNSAIFTGLTNITNNNNGTYSGNATTNSIIEVLTSTPSTTCGNNKTSFELICDCPDYPLPIVITPNSYCQNGANVLLSVANSDPNLNIIWTVNGNMQTLSSSATYTVNNPGANIAITAQFVDSNGCTGLMETLFLESDADIFVSINNPINNNCIYSANASGGSGNYTFVWTNNNNTVGTDTSQLLTDPGTYIVTVTDTVTGCTGTAQVTLTVPCSDDPCANSNLSITATSTPETCNATNTADGTITITGSGGNGNYTYTLGNIGQTNNIFSGLSTGTYQVSITDTTTGCTSNIIQVTVGDANNCPDPCNGNYTYSLGSNDIQLINTTGNEDGYRLRMISLYLVGCDDSISELWGNENNEIGCIEDIILVDTNPCPPDPLNPDNGCSVADLLTLGQTKLTALCPGATLSTDANGDVWTLVLPQIGCGFKGFRAQYRSFDTNPDCTVIVSESLLTFATDNCNCQ